MTVEGAEMLRDELNRLKNQERPALSRAIGEAIKQGDLSENADYHYAKQKQGLVEARIRLIQSKLASAEIIDIKKLRPTGKVVFGATVSLTELDQASSLEYQIVGEDEADINRGTLSVQAPLARALIGRREGDEVEVEAPSGIKQYRIETVSFPDKPALRED